MKLYISSQLQEDRVVNSKTCLYKFKCICDYLATSVIVLHTHTHTHRHILYDLDLLANLALCIWIQTSVRSVQFTAMQGLVCEPYFNSYRTQKFSTVLTMKWFYHSFTFHTQRWGRGRDHVTQSKIIPKALKLFSAFLSVWTYHHNHQGYLISFACEVGWKM